MPQGTAIGHGSGGENLTHYGAIRLRVVGSGNLDLSLHSLDNVRNSTLVTLALSSLTNREPTRLCNFIEQRAQLRIGTNLINETFKINRIIVFVKEVYSSYPG